MMSGTPPHPSTGPWARWQGFSSPSGRAMTSLNARRSPRSTRKHSPDRTGDLGLLIDRLLDQINEESAHEPGYRDKKLSPSVRSNLLRHSWPGNVRGLLNSSRRDLVGR